MTGEIKIQLTPLSCADCSEPLEINGQDIFFYCNKCGKGFHMWDHQLMPINLEFFYYRGKITGKDIRLPFWVFETNLRVKYREAKDVGISSLSELGQVLSGGKTLPGVRQNNQNGTPALFYVPAYKFDGKYSVSPGYELTMGNPKLIPDKPAPFEEIYYSLKDGEKLAEYIYLTSEIQKPDLVTRIDFSMELIKPVMRVIRFQ